MDMIEDNTVFKEVEIYYKWTIHGYSQNQKEVGECVTSKPFCVLPDTQTKWAINFYPSGYAADTSQYIAYFLKCLATEDGPVKAKYKLFLAKHGQLEAQEPAYHEYKFPVRGLHGYKKCELQTELLDPQNNFMVNDSITVCCLIKMVTNINGLGIVHPNQFVNSQTGPVDCHLSRDFEALLTSGAMSDVSLVAGGGTCKAHKNILSARSPVFAAMFSHDFHESKTNTVTIEDMSYEALKVMLHYVYTGIVEDMASFAEELFVASNKYGLESLHASCSTFLALSLSAENAAHILQLADRHDSQDLVEKTMKYIKKNSSMVYTTQSWDGLTIADSSLAVSVYKFVHKPPSRLSIDPNAAAGGQDSSAPPSSDESSN